MAQQAPKAWSDFFPSEAFSNQDDRAVLIQQLTAFFNSDQGWTHLERLKSSGDGRYSLPIDFNRLAQQCESALQEALDSQPSLALNCVSIAVHEVSWVMHLCTSKESIHEQISAVQPRATLTS